MTRAIRMLLISCAAVFTVSCGGGGGSGTIPALDRAASMSMNAPRYVASALPANFVPSAMMPNGRIPGSVGKNAAIYYKGRITDLGTFGTEYAVALSANDRGDAVGVSTTGPGVDVPGRALLFTKGTIRVLGGLAGTDYNVARAIDNSGDIYGGSGSRLNDSGPRTLQFVRFSENSGATAMNPVFFYDDENADSAIAITPSGRFIATRAGDGTAAFPNRAMIGQGTSVAPVITIDETTAADLNERGDVVGTFTPLVPTGKTVGYLHDRAGTHVLPFIPDGINERGVIVGTDNSGNVVIAQHGATFTLNSLLQSPLAVTAVLRGLSRNGAFVVQAGQTYYVLSLEGGTS